MQLVIYERESIIYALYERLVKLSNSKFTSQLILISYLLIYDVIFTKSIAFQIDNNEQLFYQKMIFIQG